MSINRWIAVLVGICILQFIPFSVMGDAPDGSKGVHGGFAEEMPGDIGEIERIPDGMTDDTWLLNIPAVSFHAMIRRSEYDNALDLYKAQLSGETGREGGIVLNSAEGCLNNIICIYDESEIIPSIVGAVEDGVFGDREIIFGLEGYTGTYAVSAVLLLDPADEQVALCNMTELTQAQQFEACRDYITEHAAKQYGAPIEQGDQIVTIIFRNGDPEADWLTVVAKEIPMLLE